MHGQHKQDAWKRKQTEAAVERMRRTPAWKQRQEAIEMWERRKAARGTEDFPEPDDADNASTQGMRGLT
jgi:hypothetical protein